MPALPVLLLRARLAVAARYNQALRRHDLTEQQWRVLTALSREDFSDIATLARRIDLLSPSVSRILRDLERRGAVQRSSGHTDARRTIASITAEGRALIEETLIDIEPVHEEIKDIAGEKLVGNLQAELLNLINILRVNR